MPTYISSDFSTSNQYIKYRLVVTETGTNINNNTSTVNIKLEAWRTNQGYTTDGHCYAVCFVDGVEYWDEWQAGDGHAISYESYTVMLERNLTIAHNADGKKIINVSAYFDHSRFSSNEQGFNVTLTDIPRQATLTGANNFNDTQNPTITYSNPAGNAVSSLQACISLNNSTPLVAYRDVNKLGSSYTFNLTSSERNALLSNTPNNNSKTVYFILKTVIGGVTYYSSKSVTFSVINASPVISGVNYADTNGTTTAITSNNQWIIQNNSTVRFTLSTLTAVKSATLKKVTITINGTTFSRNLSGTTASNTTIDIGSINSAENLSATITLEDSRGNKTTATKTVIMLAWSLPTAIYSLSRKSNYYNETYILVDGSISPLNNLNIMTIEYRYKERTATTWGAWVTIADNTTYTLDLDNQKSFDFQFKVSDRIGSTVYNKVLQIGIPILYIDRLLRSVGVGTIPNQTNMLAVDRRVSLKNTNQELVADMWSINGTGSVRSAFLRFYNSDGKTMGEFTGLDGGKLFLNTLAEKSVVKLYQNAYGAILHLNDTNEHNRVIFNCSNYNRGNGYFYDENNISRVVIYGDGYVICRNTSQNNTITNEGSTGKITCVSLVQTSSRKVKDNIKPLTPEEADKVLLLEAVTFDYKTKEQGTDKRGFIAEDVKEIIPQLVTDETETTPATLDYIELIPYLQTVIKEQAKLIEDLQKRVKALEDKQAN